MDKYLYDLSNGRTYSGSLQLTQGDPSGTLVAAVAGKVIVPMWVVSSHVGDTDSLVVIIGESGGPNVFIYKEDQVTVGSTFDLGCTQFGKLTVNTNLLASVTTLETGELLTVNIGYYLIDG